MMRGARTRASFGAARFLLAVGLTTTACEETNITGARPDVGATGLDGGFSGPLPLEVGMEIVYRGVLTAREDQATERTSAYNLTVTITAVEPDTPAVEYAVTGENRLVQNWIDVFDFSSWVGRLGPSLPDDVVGAQSVRLFLDIGPEEPPRAATKSLPVDALFFIDVRRIDAIRAAFSERFADGTPTVTGDPGNGWVFSFERTDPTVLTYETQRRRIDLEYDARGILVRMGENLGDLSNPPSGDMRLELQPRP